jgi:penicillin-binding protein 1A
VDNVVYIRNMVKNTFSSQEVYRDEGSVQQSLRRRRHKSHISYPVSRAFRYAISSIKRLKKWFCNAPSRQERRKRIVKAGLITCGLIGVYILGYALFVILTLPNVDEVGALFAAESTVITDRNGIELYRIHGDEDRTLVPLADIADTAEKATIAIEDERFYERGCFDPRAFTRAVLGNVFSAFSGSWGQGGSTITQQFSKNALIGSRKKRITRKVKEYVLSCKLEGRYTKDEILEFYLNRIPYGHNAHGVEQASRIYFAKSASGLTLAESSVLAALPQLPSYLSPYGKHVRTTLSEKGKERLLKGKIKDTGDINDDDFWIGLVGETFENPAQGSGETLYIGGRTDQVLMNMQSQSFIQEEDRINALEELQAITFKRARENIRAPHFVLWIKEFVEEKFTDQFDEGFLESGGLTVVTTLDFDLQETAESIFEEIGPLNIDLYGAHNGALLSVDPNNGQILAYVGNRDYWDEVNDGNVDIVQAPRQPGSSFKPFSYAAGFLNGYGPGTILYDVPTKIGDDEPENFDGTFMGPMTIRSALASSRNVPAAKSFFLAGGEAPIVELAADMGVETVRSRKEELSEARGSKYEYGWPLSLGAAEVPLYDMIRGYTTFARGGTAIETVAILRIEDRLGNILYSAPEEPEEKDILDPRVSYMVTSILSDESARPEGYWRTQLSVPGYQTAGKTGTSNKCFKRAGENQEGEIIDETRGAGRCIESKPDNTWTIGYTPELVTGVWAGNASGGALYIKASGLNTASSIWRRFMIAAHKDIEEPVTEFEIPEDLVSAQISELSGKLAGPCTPLNKRRAEIFLKGSAPKKFDSACVDIEVDKLTGLLASPECPKEAREAGSFFKPRSALPERWPQWESAVQEWAKQVSVGSGSIFWKVVGVDDADEEVKTFRGTGAFLPLPLPLAPTEECKLDLTPGRLEKPTVKITSPSHGGSATSPSFIPRIKYTVGHEVNEIRYELDGRIVAVADSGSEPSIKLPRRFDKSGTHSLHVILTDSYFNQVEDSVRFRFEEDKGKPVVSLKTPREESIIPIGSELKISAEAHDSGGAIDRVQFYIGDQLITTRRDSPYEIIYKVEGEPGPTVLKVKALDLAKNEGVDEIAVELIER